MTTASQDFTTLWDGRLYEKLKVKQLLGFYYDQTLSITPAMDRAIVRYGKSEWDRNACDRLRVYGAECFGQAGLFGKD